MSDEVWAASCFLSDAHLPKSSSLAGSMVSAPWGYQPHWVEHRDPVTGQTSRLIAVPAARYEGNEDARGGFGALQYPDVLGQVYDRICASGSLNSSVDIVVSSGKTPI